jgi:rod shape-determining protein MreD
VSYYIGVPLVILFGLLEASVLPMFRIAGLQPNLLLVLFVAWLMVRGPSEAFVLIPLGGFILGLVDGAPLGTALLALAPLAIVQEIRGARLSESGLVLSAVFLVAMTFLYHLIFLLVFTVQGESGSWLFALARVIVPTAFLNVLVLIPTYWVLNLSSRELRRAGYVEAWR